MSTRPALTLPPTRRMACVLFLGALAAPPGRGEPPDADLEAAIESSLRERLHGKSKTTILDDHLREVLRRGGITGIHDPRKTRILGPYVSREGGWAVAGGFGEPKFRGFGRSEQNVPSGLIVPEAQRELAGRWRAALQWTRVEETR